MCSLHYNISRIPGYVAVIDVFEISLTCRNYKLFSQQEITSDEQHMVNKKHSQNVGIHLYLEVEYVTYL